MGLLARGVERIAAAALLALTLGLSSGCVEDPERAPLRTCNGADPGACRPPTVIGGGGPEPSGDGGTANPDAEVVSGSRVAVSGRVLLLNDERFDLQQAQLFTGAALVELEAATGGFSSASTTGGVFIVPEVSVGAGTWGAVVPLDAGDWLPTLQPVDTRAAEGVTLERDMIVLRASAVDLVLGVLTRPTQRLPGGAHALLRFVDVVSLEPVPGVRVEVAEGEVAAYALGQTWTDDALGTGPDGLVLVGNVPALVYPGSEHRLVLGGAAQGNTAVRLAADAITYTVVALEPP